MSNVTGRSVGTHNGPFHADEVSACALLVLFDLVDKDEIKRTRDPKILKTCSYVCDVGGIYDPCKRLFDHHQVEYGGLLSSAGMVLQYLLDQKVIDEDLYHYFNNALIKGVDDYDNGRVVPQVGYTSFSNVIANFVPVVQPISEEEENKGFFQALDFVIWYLKRLKERFEYNLECRAIVAKAMEQTGDVLIFERSVPWIESFFELNGKDHPALFVIMPAGNHWKLRAIPPSYEQRMQVRKPLPKKWAGLLDDELKKVCKIPGAIFCHKGRFISVWETKEDALRALQIVLNEEEE